MTATPLGPTAFAPWTYVTCPVCGDDVKFPADAERQGDALRSIAFALVERAAAIDKGLAQPLQPYGGALDWHEWLDPGTNEDADAHAALPARGSS